MGLKEPFMVKQVYGDTAFTLTAKPDTSILIKDIVIENPAASPGYVTLKTGKAVVGFFRVAGNLGNQLSVGMGSARHSHAIAHNHTAVTSPTVAQIVDALGVAITTLGIEEADGAAKEHANVVKHGSVQARQHKTLMQLLIERGWIDGYPVGEGETFLLEGVKQAGSLQLVTYEIHDAGDMKPEMPNGSKAKDYCFINYGRPAAAIATTVDTLYNTVQSPAEFPDFPFGKNVPADYEIKILAILASDVVDDRGSDDTMNTEYVKLIKGRETLFDEDKNGLFHKGIIGTTDAAAQFARGYSLFGNFSDVDGKLPKIFTPALVFASGQELGIYLSCTAGTSQSASSLAAADVEIGLIEHVKTGG